MASRVNNSAFFADAEDPRYQTGNLWELPVQEDNPLMAHPGGMAQNGPMISNPLAAPPPQQQGGGFMPNAPQQAVPGQPPPQPGGMNAAMDSPYAQMAGAGLQNLVNTSLGQYGSQVSPIQAYQQAVQQRAVLNQREQTLKQAQSAEERAQSQEKRDANPMYEFEQFVQKQGLEGLPFDQQLEAYKKFNTASSSALGMSNRVARTFIGDNGNMWTISADGTPTDTGIKGTPPASEITSEGGVSYVKETLPGGEVRMTPLSDYQTQYRQGQLSGEEGAKVAGRSYEERDQAFLDLVDSGGVDQMEQSLASTEALLAEMDNGAFADTGYLEGPVRKIFGSPEAARLEFLSMSKALENLQITNLAPVTENEIAMIKDLFAKIGADPEQNKAVLKEAATMIRGKLDLINKKGEYFANNGGTLRGYGTGRWTKPAEPEGAPTVAAKTYNPETGEIE